jgi:hypothetical protein
MSENMGNTSDKKILDMTKKVEVCNTTAIDTYVRCTERNYDAKIPKKNSTYFTIGEILAQVYSGNPDFVGIDKKGSHASLYINDKDVRIEVGFDSPDGKKSQEKVDEQSIINLFSIDNMAAFVEALQNKVRTMGEQQTLKEIIASDRINAHDKIETAKKYLNGEQLNVEKPKAGRPKKNESE